MFKKKTIKMKAWLITWEGTSKKITAENQIIAIISSRRSGAFVEDLVDTLCQMTSDTAYGMAYLANRKKERYIRNNRSNAANIGFGNNPIIYARRVSDFKIVKNENDLTETVVWHEPAVYVRDPDNVYDFKEVEPPKLKQLTRSIYVPLLSVIP